MPDEDADDPIIVDHMPQRVHGNEHQTQWAGRWWPTPTMGQVEAWVVGDETLRHPGEQALTRMIRILGLACWG